MGKTRSGQTPDRPEENPAEPLTNPRHEVFAQAYIDNKGNVTDAAKAAEYKQPHVQGSQILKKLSVQRRIAFLQKEIAQAKKITREWVADRLMEVVEFDPSGMVGTDKFGDLTLVPKEEWPEGALRHLGVSTSSTVGESSSRSFSFRFRDSRVGALKEINKMMGFYSEAGRDNGTPEGVKSTFKRVGELMARKRRK